MLLDAVKALSWLLTMPGASNTMLDAQVPYANKALEQLLGAAPASAASPEATSQLAVAAYKRAVSLAGFGAPAIGVSCSCALATNRPKKGEHKVSWPV